MVKKGLWAAVFRVLSSELWCVKAPKLARLGDIEMKLASTAIALALAFSSASEATTFDPTDAPVAIGGPFGTVAEVVGTSYIGFGVDFSWGGDEGVFSDPPPAWGGVNGSGVVDLVSAVDGRIVVEGTTNQGLTDYFYAEAGFAAIGSLTLELFDISMNLIASVLNDDPLGVNGRTTFSYTGAGIAFFRISGLDSFGVNEISLNTPTAAVIPVPAALPLMLLALGGLGLVARRRQAQA